jgi:hypothetical protein
LQTSKSLSSRRLAGRSQTAGHRRATGSLIETLAGFAIIIPLGLFAVDLTTVVSASQLNERLAEDAARAAGNMGDQFNAQAAAEAAISSYQVVSPIAGVEVTSVGFDVTTSQVQVVTHMTVNLPVPVGTIDKVTLNADAVQPIVSIPAPP